MSMQNTVEDNYSNLIGKLDEFIRKFYVNKAIKGALWFIGLASLLYTLALAFEHFVFLNQLPAEAVSYRKMIFWSFLGSLGLAFAFWVANPLFRYLRLGKVISHEQAASIIGQHFTNVQDKLLNILQLKRQSLEVSGHEDFSLYTAGINQKIEELRPIPFKKAIDLTKNKKHLRFIFWPFGLIALLLVLAPGFIGNGTFRLFNNSTEFEKEAPFTFVPENQSPSAMQYTDYTIKVRAEGNERPSEAYIDINGYQYKLTELEPGLYSYTFSKVAEDMTFRFKGGGVVSKSYKLEVHEKPTIANFVVTANYPDYTGRADEELTNVGDFTLPQGTVLSWKFSAKYTESLQMRFNFNEPFEATKNGSEEFEHSRKIMQDAIYKVFIANQFMPKGDSVAYSLTVIPDMHPSIQVRSFVDSASVGKTGTTYFGGDASDDYGIKSLGFHYSIERKKGGTTKQVVPLGIKGKTTAFEYVFNPQKLNLQPGDKVTYFFEVWDNDGVNGSKSARTEVMTYAQPSLEDIAQKTEENSKAIKDNLDESIKDAMKLQQDAKKLQEELLQKKEPDWQDKKKLENLLKQQKELEKQLQQSQQDFQENKENLEKMGEKPTEEMMKKQELLEKLFNQVMDKEMQEMLKKMEEMMDKINKEELLEQLKDMNLNNKELEKELDRMLEMFKQMEAEKAMKEAIDKLEELAKKEEELSEKTEKEQKSAEELKKEQDQLNKEFEKVQEKMDEAKKKNEELEKPDKFDDQKDDQKDVEKDMKESSDDLKKQDKKEASKKQKSAAQKMKKMANKMKSDMKGAKQKKNQEDMAAIRQLLENIVTLSFDQEKLMKNVAQVEINTPSYIKTVQEQYKIKDDFRIIEDSLHALSKRVTEIEKFVTEKVTDVKQNLNKSIKELEERYKNEANTSQQYSMTYLNDLALMLAESLQQMQQSQAQEQEGDQMCENPGNKKGKKGKPKKSGGDMQKDLNEQMDKLSEQLKKGEKGQKLSKEFGQMAAKQAAMRRLVQQMQQERQQQGKGQSKELQDIMNQMDKTETELLNKQLSNETMKRQQDILTRLLEHDKAEREREKDEKRESKTAQEREVPPPPAFQEYLKQRQSQIDLYRTTSPNLKPFYKSIVDSYLNSIR